ncbi:hypothetical protein EPO17_02900 [Patescibacteria group bacterium]|nr:MAG: hypothetical protein EPO17_02900 [Patescibacteria group bacterium]
MTYRVVLAGRPICRPDIMRSLDFIPGTEQEMVLGTDSGLGRMIWHGYLDMRQAQKSQKIAEDDWRKIRVPEDAKPENEIHKFREAIDLFCRFQAGEGRDNCNAVKDISPLPA